MAAPIRPGFNNPAPQAAPRPDAARNAAQRAFFQAAMGQASAPAAPRAQVQPQAQAPRVTAAPQAAAPPAGRIPTNLPPDPPARILRPGSLLDIKV
jgi:hypothetical protein